MVPVVKYIWNYFSSAAIEEPKDHKDQYLQDIIENIALKQKNYENEFGKENEDIDVICTRDNDKSLIENTDDKVEEENSTYDPIILNKNNYEHKEFIIRSILTKILNKYGQILKLSDDNQDCNLDEVECDFVPMEGDLIIIETEVTPDKTSFNFDGEIIKYCKVKACLNSLKEYVITSYNKQNGQGVAGHEVYFSKESFSDNYTPSIGDMVMIQTINSYHKKYKLRALTLEPTENQHPNNYEVAVKTNIDYLCLPKNGIIIHPCTFEVKTIGEQALLTITVSNKGSETQIIEEINFQLQSKDNQLELVTPRSKEEMEIKPENSFKFRIKGTSKFYGYSKELIVLKFRNNFAIGSYVNISVCVKRKLKAKFQRHLREDKINKLRQLRMLDEIDVIPGRPPFRSIAFVKNKLPSYNKPEYLEDAIFGQPGDIFGFLRTFKSILQNVPNLGKPLTMETYCNVFHTLLFLNEIEIDFRMREFDMDRACFKKFEDYLALDIENLSDESHSLPIGGRVIAISTTDDNEYPFIGFIHKINSKTILLKFNEAFHSSYEGQDYIVKFMQSRTTYRKSHQGIDLVFKGLGEYILFPNEVKKQTPLRHFKIVDGELLTQEYNKLENKSNNFEEKLIFKSNRERILASVARDKKQLLNNNNWQKVHWFNNQLNALQKEAVKNILLGEARPMPYIIFGPPGTGKTVTVVETILQILKLIPNSRILLASPSNSSSNLLTTRLKEFGLSTDEIIRVVGHHLVENDGVPLDIAPYCATLDVALERTRDSKIKLLETGCRLNLPKSKIFHRVVIGTCITLADLYTMGFEPGYFSHVIVDEAGQITEPDIMIPLANITNEKGQIILAGDPKQLGPFVASSFADKLGLGKSFLTRLLEQYPYRKDTEVFPNSGGYKPELVTCLTYNYRSVPEILKISSDMFYESELISQVSQEEGSKILKPLADLLPTRSEGGPLSIIFHGVQGQEEQTPRSPSWLNRAEAAQILSFLTKLYSRNIQPDSIGIISPYQKQVELFNKLIQDNNLPTPKIGSVEAFQGQERQIIIISTVRSAKRPNRGLEPLGFIQDFRRLNVAITRAKSLLVIFGNPHVLTLNKNWATVIKYCIDIGGYTGCDLPTNLLNLNGICSEV